MEERLQKYMARCGVASRRKCEEIITSGVVKVNEEIITELGFKVDGDSDKVYVQGNLIEVEENKVYFILNKPRGYVSTVKDEKDRSTILDIVKVKERIYPIGRLDYDTSGLMLLTNDGDVFNKVIHPREEINKKYVALIEGSPTENEINKFCTGVYIDGYKTAKAKFVVLREFSDKTEVEITIHEGKNRQVRKMCDAIGHSVISLKRISVGKIELGKMPQGEYRSLTFEEVEYLKSL